jgi:hypothetical protein
MRKNRKIGIWTAMAAALGLVIMATGARATTSYEVGDLQSVGATTVSAETSYLTSLINLYNAGDKGTKTSGGMTYSIAPGSYVPSPMLPSVTSNGGQTTKGVNGSGMKTGLEVNLATGGYDYVIVKWGSQDEMYYVAGLKGNITLNNDVNGSTESHFDLCVGAAPPASQHGAPDSASTVSLLGVSVAGLSYLRRKLRK